MDFTRSRGFSYAGPAVQRNITESRVNTRKKYHPSDTESFTTIIHRVSTTPPTLIVKRLNLELYSPDI